MNPLVQSSWAPVPPPDKTRHPTRRVNIADDADLTVRVIEYTKKRSRAEDEKPIVRQITDFSMRRDVIASNSSVLAMLLRSSRHDAPIEQVIELKEDSSRSLEVWFTVFHETHIHDTCSVPLSEMWNLVSVGDKYSMDLKRLNTWFATWYADQNLKELDARQLLFPCWAFDHARGFLSTTKKLVYESTRHITELNPTTHYQLHLPGRIIQQLNAAKGRLRTILQRDLFKPIDPLLRDAHCPCKAETVFSYQKALMFIDVWPLENVAFNTPMNEILNRLEGFAYTPQEHACDPCSKPLEYAVEAAESHTRDYFDGLCLDCMDKHKAKTGDEDTDYVLHNKLRHWDLGCRVRHGEPSWYFSFMGRKEKKNIA